MPKKPAATAAALQKIIGASPYTSYTRDRRLEEVESRLRKFEDRMKKAGF